MDKETKEALGKIVQKKGKSIKDCYYKNVKMQDDKSGDSSKPRKHYIYHKQLSFLQPLCVESGPTSGNMAVDLTESTQAADNKTAQQEASTTPETQHTTSKASLPARTAQREKVHYRRNENRTSLKNCCWAFWNIYNCFSPSHMHSRSELHLKVTNNHLSSQVAHLQ
ncbi:uncharacterized protein LOC126354373 [Schistocerca gregaria]|uniref:uncharacterized protein LOC126354373 n=1 Tax=Schistocerca gregaria TaxID=7010 RepID=UPI00211E12E6|nr:uncharacterized protein LOC126354373 [Schistocerca gregaria]